jgi:carbamoyl-phosphate synthase small subunit
MPDNVYLVLEDGTVFEGYGFGARGDVVGETVFTTGMTGYLETLTDKSYYGQIITQTFPLIGNYGVIPEDFESKDISAKGYIVRQWCQDPSNFRSRGNLDTFLRERGVVGLYGIDTRRLTKAIREKGVMNGMITCSPKSADMERIRGYRIEGALAAVSVKEQYTQRGGGRYSVALMDYGLKENIKRELLRRGCDVTVFPHDAAAGEVLAARPDGVLLSNGPGDPRDAENAAVIGALRELCDSGAVVFGICLGHQLLALAHGFAVEKLKYGHRGANQPARDRRTGRSYITSQNHGYAVVSSSIDGDVAEEWFVNVNDGTSEGILYKDKPVLSVQFHPEAASGPRDTSFLFDKFVDMMGVRRDAAR